MLMAAPCGAENFDFTLPNVGIRRSGAPTALWSAGGRSPHRRDPPAPHCARLSTENPGLASVLSEFGSDTEPRPGSLSTAEMSRFWPAQRILIVVALWNRAKLPVMRELSAIRSPTRVHMMAQHRSG